MEFNDLFLAASRTLKMNSKYYCTKRSTSNQRVLKEEKLFYSTLLLQYIIQDSTITFFCTKKIQSTYCFELRYVTESRRVLLSEYTCVLNNESIKSYYQPYK